MSEPKSAIGVYRGFFYSHLYLERAYSIYPAIVAYILCIRFLLLSGFSYDWCDETVASFMGTWTCLPYRKIGVIARRLNEGQSNWFRAPGRYDEDFLTKFALPLNSGYIFYSHLGTPKSWQAYFLRYVSSCLHVNDLMYLTYGKCSE